MKLLEGKLIADGMKVGIVCSRFNEFYRFQTARRRNGRPDPPWRKR